VEPNIIGSLAGLGAAGAVIIALVLTQKARAEADKEAALLKAAADKESLDRTDKIVDRHLAAEAANRDQVRDLSEQNRALFDRVITVCTSLGIAIQELSASTKAQERAILELSTNTKANERALLELSASTKANEKAITDLRAEFRSLGGPQSPKALGHNDPRPFGPG
jgi:hypothetical protein